MPGLLESISSELRNPEHIDPNPIEDMWAVGGVGYEMALSQEMGANMHRFGGREIRSISKWTGWKEAWLIALRAHGMCFWHISDTLRRPKFEVVSKFMNLVPLPGASLTALIPESKHDLY